MAAAEKSMMPPWSREFSHPESSSQEPSSACSTSAWAGLTFVFASEETQESRKNEHGFLQEVFHIVDSYHDGLGHGQRPFHFQSCGGGSPSICNLLSSASACAAKEQKLGWLRMLSWTAELILRWSNSSLSDPCSGGSLKSSLYSSNHVWTKANRGLRRQWKNHYSLTI